MIFGFKIAVPLITFAIVVQESLHCNYLGCLKQLSPVMRANETTNNHPGHFYNTLAN